MQLVSFGLTRKISRTGSPKAQAVPPSLPSVQDSVHFGKTPSKKDGNPMQGMIDQLKTELADIQGKLKKYEEERQTQVKAGTLKLREQLSEDEQKKLPSKAIGLNARNRPVFINALEKFYLQRKAEIEKSLPKLEAGQVDIDDFDALLNAIESELDRELEKAESKDKPEEAPPEKPEKDESGKDEPGKEEPKE